MGAEEDAADHRLGTGVYMHVHSGGMLIGNSDPDEPPGSRRLRIWTIWPGCGRTRRGGCRGSRRRR